MFIACLNVCLTNDYFIFIFQICAWYFDSLIAANFMDITGKLCIITKLMGLGDEIGER